MIILLLAFCFSSITWATDLPSYIGVWKYSGNDFNSVRFLDLTPFADGTLKRSSSAFLDLNKSASLSPYHSREGGLQGIVDMKRQNPIIHELDAHQDLTQHGKCNILPIMNQLFAIDQMVRRNVIPKQLQDELISSITKLSPDQLTFVETIRSIKEDLLIKQFGEIPKHARKNPNLQSFTPGNRNAEMNDLYIRAASALEHTPLPEPIPYYDLKTSTAVIISGQTPGKIHSLPLEKSLSNSTLKNAIDRKDFPLIWEIGRYAQVKAEDAKWTLEALTLQMKSEIAQMNGKIEDAYLFAHSTDPTHTKLYESLYGMKPHSEYLDQKGEMVLSIKLSDLEKKLKLKNVVNETYVSPNGLMKSIQDLSTATVVIPKEEVFFRTFDGKEIGKLVSTHDQIAASKGAINPDLVLGYGQSYFDPQKNLYISGNSELTKKIRAYYEKNPSLHYSNDKYYLRSRFNDLKAVAFDGVSRKEATLTDFDKHLASYILLQKNSLQPLKNETIAFSVKGSLNPEIQSALAPHHLKAENIYHEPDLIHRLSRMTRITYKGDRMNLYWMSMKDARSYIEANQEKFDLLYQKLNSELKPEMIQKRLWGDPLSGT